MQAQNTRNTFILQFNHLSFNYGVVLLKINYICTQFNYNFKLQ